MLQADQINIQNRLMVISNCFVFDTIKVWSSRSKSEQIIEEIGDKNSIK